MTAFQSWLLFASLTALGTVTYNACLKLGGTANASAFVLIIGITEAMLMLAAFAVTKYAFKVNWLEGMTHANIGYAVGAGVSVILLDACFFLALRYGSAITTQVFTGVAGTITFVAFAMIFFQETITLQKIIGIILGVVSIALVIL